MKKRKLLTWSEGKVDRILSRRLSGSPYRVLVNVRLSDAIGKDPAEVLPQEDFDFLTRAHLDFLIVTNTRPADPVFAIEFDGPHHSYTVQIERDIRKNRLCKEADLPLLRIELSDIQEYDKLTLLDYMLDRYLSWQREEESILNEIKEFVSELPPEEARIRFEDSDPSVDPSFLFDLRHPFPATGIVKQRLLQKYKIAREHSRPREVSSALYLFKLGWKYEGPDKNEQYHKCVQQVTLWEGMSQILFETEVSASVRSWLPTNTEIPDPPRLFPTLFTEKTALNALLQRVNAMWFPNLPGISAWYISEQFAEYLAYRAVEQWAQKYISRKPNTI